MHASFGALVVSGLVAGWALTGAARRFALSRAILDRPNERSSHAIPMPLGGGWGIAAPVLAAIAMAEWLGWLDRDAALGLAGGGAAVAIVGWVDDRIGLSARTRLLVQVGAALWLVVWLGGFDGLDVGAGRAHLGRWGDSLAVLAIVWSTNLYNFMDGIDGIAGTEAVSVAGVGGVLLLLAGSSGLALVALVTAAASAGFLVWNRPPARIFMGDAGSGLLGFVLSGLAVAGEVSGAAPALVWVLLLGAFVGDATSVLLRRMARGERWYSAHRGHLYQRMVQAGWSHGDVDRALAGLNAVLALLGVAAWRWRWMLPWALGAGAVVIAVAFRAAGRNVSTRGIGEGSRTD
jgi:Fuc2NAc and GlcNAc transferase